MCVCSCMYTCVYVCVCECVCVADYSNFGKGSEKQGLTCVWRFFPHKLWPFSTVITEAEVTIVFRNQETCMFLF